MHKKIIQISLLAGDLLILFLSLFLTLLIRYREIPSSLMWEKHLSIFYFVFIFWILSFYTFNFYNLHYATITAKFYERASQSIIIATVVSLAFFYLIPSSGISPKTNLLIFVMISSILFLTSRNLGYWLLSSRLPKIKIAIVGVTKNTLELLNELQSKPYLGYKAISIFNIGDSPNLSALDLPALNNIPDFQKNITDNKVEQIILACDPTKNQELQNILFNFFKQNIKILTITNFFEKTIGKIPLEEITQIWFLENLNETDKKIFNFFKRTNDLFLSAFALLISLPFWIPIAFLIKFESRGPVFIQMRRCGQNGQTFKMYKFRTMREENNNRTPTITNDPRITCFGKILRKTRLDEIPQLINILRGEMSFVGPRPERPELAKDLEREIPFYRERELVKPGVTGWDQISGEYHSPSVEDTLKKMQYDLYYIKNRSIYLDFSIILKTIATIFSRGGV
jgi:exopolysaccharide biosynthesis polyprenyl glycosylphosphotransferase